MADQNDDIILEIIARLPMRYAVQCSILNRNFRKLISGSSFRRLMAAVSPPSIFCCSTFCPFTFTKLGRPPKQQVLDRSVSIKASCNGLLLLEIKRSHYVFNPLTRAIMKLHAVFFFGVRHVTLAVDWGYSHFKLVTMDALHRENLTFRVYAPISDRRLIRESTVRFARDPSFNSRFGGEVEDGKMTMPVYAEGCVYWLADDGTATALFDVEKEKVRMIEGPLNLNQGDWVSHKWFGFCEGSINVVYAFSRNIMIWELDERKGEWRVKHRIGNISNHRNNDDGNGKPVFYDGRRLYFHTRISGRDGNVDVYDVERKRWAKNHWVVAGWKDRSQLFFSYFPTTAGVSGLDIHSIKGRPSFKRTLRGLRRLFNRRE